MTLEIEKLFSYIKAMVSNKSTKILWAAAAGRCSFPDCWEKLCRADVGKTAPFTIGEMAHIRGEKPGSNRHDPSQPEVERDDYANLILLCPTHHCLIDRKENESIYTVKMLHEMKKEHEAKILERLDCDTPCRLELAHKILIFLVENRESWAQYGPQSNIARKEPNNAEVYAVWCSETLSIIVPNNRNITEILEEHRQIFHANEQEAISSFLIHARSYERWVRDEIPYSAVVRFPPEFEAMINEVVHDRI